MKRIEDPIGLLPAKLILGINKRGVHFFRPVPKEYIHSAELRDIMQFGSSSQAVFFKMRVAGESHGPNCHPVWACLLGGCWDDLAGLLIMSRSLALAKA